MRGRVGQGAGSGQVTNGGVSRRIIWCSVVWCGGTHLVE